MKISAIKFDAAKPAPVAKPAATQEGRSLKALWAELVARHPEVPALVDDRSSMSFAELDAFSASIARFILSKNYGPEPAVGVMCRRGGLVIAAGLGAMRAGAVYLPVDREMPQARVETMLKPVRLILTDSSCLRDAEYFQYKNPGIEHILCLDAAETDEVSDRGNELGRTSFWEHVAEAGSDEGWRSYFDGEKVPARVLEEMGAGILRKTGLPGRTSKRVLDIGCGSGVVARALIDAADCYTGIDLARNELGRVEVLANDGRVTVHQLAAADICFLEGERFDLICLNSVVENFPGYNYLRKVLDLAVERLADDGVLFIGAAWDLGKRDAFRTALKDHALKRGDNKGLIRFDDSAELFLSERFFADWAAGSRTPVEYTISAPAVDCAEIADYRFDVVIRKSVTAKAPAEKRRLGTGCLSALPPCELPECEPNRAAYIVYTSGSTGVPKGVVEEHRHLLHIIAALKEFSEGCERVALFAPLTFDASIQQLCLSLFCGKPLHILSDEDRKSPENFRRCVERHGIDVSDMTPAFFNVLVEHLSTHKQSLPMKRLLIAGEVLRPDTVQKFYGIPGNEKVVIFNVYGPTECTVDTTTHRIDFANHGSFPVFPIGRPLEGTVVTVRDKNGQALPDSVAGEICISGAGVSRGYFNVDGSSAFVTLDGQRAYRSGDFGFMEKGVVFYLGREDQQVKIRGNRVEIGEVENAIAGYPGVRQVVVLADSFLANEDKALAAYVVGDVDLTQLRSYLEQLLPSYCVPGYFVPMSELPLTTNRKVDKKVLPSPKLAATRREGRKLSGPVEEALAAIWKKLLGVTVTDAEANFFDLGGHSILAVRLIAMVEKELSLSLTLSDLFTHPTIGQLSALLAGKTTQANSPVIRLSHHEGAKNLFLFHPIGGSVFCYSELARLLGDKFTVYAVEAAGFSPERNVLNTELNSVEDLAEHYLGEILKVASGEVIFGGWSFGGILAYETACLFEATTGRDCGAVLILDTMVDNSMARTVATKDDAAMLKTILEDLIALDEETLRRLPRDERLRYLVGEVQASGLLPEGFNIVQMENLLQTYRSNAVAAARYVRPSRTDKDILLVRALEVSESTQAYVHDKYLGWGAFLPEEKITLRWTEGSHETMLSPGLVGGVAKHLLEYLTHE